ncbi:TonB-dependent receptor [Luteimonas aestuarii]|nr:TonB-dependent receptor [Luteimonas aestuarii]
MSQLQSRTASRGLRIHRLAACVLSALCCQAIAVAQEPAEPGQAPASGPAAQPTEAIELDRMVVTARRRDEREQDVPIAMSVLDGNDLETGGDPNLQEIYRQVPSLRVVNTNPRNVSMTIRGLGANLASEMLVNSVGVFVDGVYYARPGASAFDFIDIEQMEILRGPQGTLFGKNTTAGALNITTRGPSFQPEGALQVGVGNYGYRRIAGTASGGFSETVAGRLTASVTSRDGTMHNVRTGRDVNDYDDKSVRGQLLFDPGNGVTLMLTADYSKQDLDCCTDVIDRVITTLDDGTPIANGFYARSALVGYTPLPVDPFARRTDIDSRQNYQIEQSGLAAKLDWRLDSGHTFTSITAHRRWSFDPYNDLDMIGLPILTQGAFFSDSKTTTQELRLASPDGRALEYVVGLFYMKDRLTSDTFQEFGAAAGPWILPGLPQALSTLALDGLQGVGESRVDTRSAAVFGHATWHVNDRFDLALGLRYTDERKSGFSVQAAQGGVPLADIPPALAPTVAAIRAASVPAFDTRTISGYPQSNDEGDLSGTVSGTWKISDDVTGYASYSRGYKSGGINFGANVPASSETIEPENANSYELGLKSRLLGNRIMLNLSAFRTDVENYQSSRVFTSPVGATTIYVANVPEIRSQGAEIDALYLAGRGLTLGASVAYTDAYYVSAPVSQCAGVNPTGLCDLSGRALTNVSRWAGHARAHYEFQRGFGSGGVRPYVGGDVSYRSGFYSGPSEQTWVPSFSLFNFRAGVRFGERGTDVSLWVNNAFDKEYYLYRSPLIFGTGAIVGRLGNPRMYGITFRQQF